VWGGTPSRRNIVAACEWTQFARCAICAAYRTSRWSRSERRLRSRRAAVRLRTAASEARPPSRRRALVHNTSVRSARVAASPSESPKDLARRSLHNTNIPATGVAPRRSFPLLHPSGAEATWFASERGLASSILRSGGAVRRPTIGRRRRPFLRAAKPRARGRSPARRSTERELRSNILCCRVARASKTRA